MAAKPAYLAKLSVGGAATAFVAGATTLVLGKTYQLNSSVQRVLDPNTPRVWKDAGVAIAAANIASEDLLFGKVTLAASYVPGGAITLDGSYIPKVAVALVKKLDIDEKTNNQGSDALNSAGFKTRLPVLFDATASFDVFDTLDADLDPVTVGTQSFHTFLRSRLPMLLEVDPDGTATSVFRAWMVLDDDKVAYDPQSLIVGSVQMSLAAQGNVNALAGAAWGAP
jgi:hypothetical protein